MAKPQRKPHEQDVLLQAVRQHLVAYGSVNGRAIGIGIPIHERPTHPPKGTIYEQEFFYYEDVVEEDGTPFGDDQVLIRLGGPRKYLCGRVVTGHEAVEYARNGVSLDERALAALIGGEIQESNMRVLVIQHPGGVESPILLQDSDIPPPAGASPYPVGESPEEMAVADAKAYAEGAQDDLRADKWSDDEVEAIREAAKAGFYHSEDQEYGRAADGKPPDGQVS